MSNVSALVGKAERQVLARQHARRVIGVTGPDDDAVTVLSTGERLTAAEWTARYPAGLLIRIVYADDWQEVTR